MLRVVALNVLLFLSPFIVYALALLIQKGTIRTASDWTLARVLQLGGAGILILLIGVVLLTSFDGGTVGQHYQPAVLVDGQVRPGGFVDP